MSPFRLSDEYRYASRGIQAELSAGLEDEPSDDCPVCGSSEHDGEFCPDLRDGAYGKCVVCGGIVGGMDVYCETCEPQPAPALPEGMPY